MHLVKKVDFHDLMRQKGCTYDFGMYWTPVGHPITPRVEAHLRYLFITGRL